MLQTITNLKATLLNSICYDNIDKVMYIADEFKWHVDPVVGFLVGYCLMLIVMVWTLLAFPWNVLRGLTFWLNFLIKTVDDHFHGYSKKN
jgi:hypothetical protein